jgi:opacity protein-like surface antigen
MKRFGLLGFLLAAEVQQKMRLCLLTEVLKAAGFASALSPIACRSIAARQSRLFRYGVALVATTLLLCVAAIPNAHAEAGDHAVGLVIGQTWPAGEIGQGLDGAVAPGLFYEYAASDVFSVYASGVRSSHNDGALKLTSTNVGIKANLFYIDKLSPYAMLGAGLYFVDKAYGSERAEKTNFGLHLGLGAELDLSDLFFMGLEFDVHNLFSSTVNLPIRGRTEISGRWSGFFLRGGVRF